MSETSCIEKPGADLSLSERLFPRSLMAKRLASYFKSVRFNLKEVLDFFIAQTALVEVFVPMKTWF